MRKIQILTLALCGLLASAYAEPGNTSTPTDAAPKVIIVKSAAAKPNTVTKQTPKSRYKKPVTHAKKHKSAANKHNVTQKHRKHRSQKTTKSTKHS